MPTRQDLYRMDGTRIAVINEGAVPELAQYKLTPEEFVETTADDGTKLQASIIKPVDFDQFIMVVRSIEDFWLTIVTLPGK